MGHRNAFLDDEVANVVNPNRHPVFEPEFAQVLRAFKIELATRSFFGA